MSDLHFKRRKRHIVAAPMSSKGHALLKMHDMEDGYAAHVEAMRELYRKAWDLGLRLSFEDKDVMDEIAGVKLK